MIRVPFLVLILVSVIACGPGAYSENPDAEVVEQLRLAGSNLVKPHPIEFFFYFPTEDSANNVCNVLRSKEYSVSAQPSASTDEHLCLATKLIVPTVEGMTQLRLEFEQLAGQFDGLYDGWGTDIVE